MQEMKIEPRPTMGFAMWGFVLGAFALALALLQFFGGPFAPQQSIGTTIGEIAAEMRMSAWNKLTGGDDAPTASAAPAWDIDKIMIVGAMALAAIAIFLGGLGFVRHEPKRPVAMAFVMGGVAITFQFFASALMLILGVILLVGIMSNLGEILGDWMP